MSEFGFLKISKIFLLLLLYCLLLLSPSQKENLNSKKLGFNRDDLRKLKGNDDEFNDILFFLIYLCSYAI